MAEGKETKVWSNKGKIITCWDGHDNHRWPRNTTAPRYDIPEFPGEDCSDSEWARYNENWQEWEELVRQRWRWLSNTKRYKNKKV